MFDPERLLRQMIGGQLGGAFGKHDRKKYKKHKHGGGLGRMLGAGGLGKAQVGLGLLGVAVAAYEHYQSGRQGGDARAAPPPTAAAPPPPPPPPPGAHAPPPPPPGSSTATLPPLDPRRYEAALLVRAMVAAAAADGHIDDDERAGVLQHAREAGDDADTVAWLEAELRQPVSLEQLAAQTPRSLAEPVYAAALIAIDVDTEAERAWLDRLATALGIDPAQRQAIAERLEAP